MCGAALWFVWHFGLCGEWILEVPPPRVWRGTLIRVALNFIQDPPDTSMIVGYILVIPTPGGMLRQTLE